MSAAVSDADASIRSPAHRPPGRRPIRSTGPDTDTAAITSPAGERTGAETDATPASRSATDCAQPRRRTSVQGPLGEAGLGQHRPLIGRHPPRR